MPHCTNMTIHCVVWCGTCPVDPQILIKHGHFSCSKPNQTNQDISVSRDTIPHFITTSLPKFLHTQISVKPMAKVELRELGNTGLKLSCVGFGASPLGNVFGPVSDEEAIGSVREAFRRGINFFDTSPYVTVSSSSVSLCSVIFGLYENM